MRLIDCDKLKEVFKRNTGYDYADIIDAQPTAYDVDKVVEELDERISSSTEDLIKSSAYGNLKEIDKYYASKIAFQDAIKIVRRGVE